MKLGEFRKLTENLSDDVEINFYYVTESLVNIPLWIEFEDKENIQVDKTSQELNITMESSEDLSLDLYHDDLI